MKPGPPKKGYYLGHRNDALETGQLPGFTRGQSRSKGIPIPDADPNWRPEAQSWFRSLKLSGQSANYQASDWSTAVAAAQAYDIFLRTYNASILSQFVRLSERLGVTIVDRARARIQLDEPGDRQDIDENAADATIINWQARLNKRVPRYPDGDKGA